MVYIRLRQPRLAFARDRPALKQKKPRRGEAELVERDVLLTQVTKHMGNMARKYNSKPRALHSNTQQPLPDHSNPTPNYTEFPSPNPRSSPTPNSTPSKPPKPNPPDTPIRLHLKRNQRHKHSISSLKLAATPQIRDSTTRNFGIQNPRPTTPHFRDVRPHKSVTQNSQIRDRRHPIP